MLKNHKFDFFRRLIRDSPFFVHQLFKSRLERREEIMDKSRGKLTVFFEKPFWVGVFERIEDGKLSVTKVTFGTEPKD